MKLDEIEGSSEVFIDANIFIYHFTGVGDQCSDFLNRCEQGDLIATTSVNVLLEVLHRLMIFVFSLRPQRLCGELLSFEFAAE